MSREYGLSFVTFSNLGPPGSVEDLLFDFINKGFAIAHLRVGEYTEKVYALWHHFDEDVNLQAAYDHGHLAVLLHNDDEATSSFDMWLRINWDPSSPGGGHLYAYVTRLAAGWWFGSRERSQYSSQRMLDVGNAIYDNLQPTYGCVDQCGESGMRKSGTSFIATNQLTHIYWANYWGPSMVSSVGLEQLSTLSAGTTSRLTDGGVCYVLSPNIKDKTPATTATAIKEHFGAEVRCHNKVAK